MLGIVGKKIGMSRIYDSKGAVIPVTLIQLYECCVSDINSLEDKESTIFFTLLKSLL